jgi:hypothetical protein
MCPRLLGVVEDSFMRGYNTSRVSGHIETQSTTSCGVTAATILLHDTWNSFAQIQRYEDSSPWLLGLIHPFQTPRLVKSSTLSSRTIRVALESS